MKRNTKKYSISIVIAISLLCILGSCRQKNVDNISYNVKDPSKMHFITVSDTHWYSPFALDCKLEDIPQGGNTMYLGDIYDVARAKNEEVDDVLRKVRQLREKMGDRYVRGNREGNAFRPFLENNESSIPFQQGDKVIDLSEVDFAIRSQKDSDRILFVHGHKGIDPDYDAEKIKKIEQTQGGTGWFFQRLIPIGAWARHMRDNTPSDQAIENAVQLAVVMNCQTIVFGHTHIDSLFDKQFTDEKTGKTIRVINVPRGITSLEL